MKNKKKILVTGSEGSLMQYVIPVLMDQGYEVIGVDNFARYGEIERKRKYAKQIIFVVKNIRKKA